MVSYYVLSLYPSVFKHGEVWDLFMEVEIWEHDELENGAIPNCNVWLQEGTLW